MRQPANPAWPPRRLDSVAAPPHTCGVGALPHFPLRPIVIAHRGASGALPEQTLEAFDLAIDCGADAIELDVVPTRDGVLMARHENELSLTTNIATLPQFAQRRSTKVVDGKAITGWFCEDFRSDELTSLRARQRFPFRSHASDDRFRVPTLAEVLHWRDRRNPRVGVFIEIKHPTYFGRCGHDVADLLSRSLEGRAMGEPSSGIVGMSFEPGVLRRLKERTKLAIVQLLDAPEARPFDWSESGSRRTFADLLTGEGLAEVRAYADGIGPWKRLIVPALQSERGEAPIRLDAPTDLVERAHAAGLFVCSWTFRDEPRYLAADYAGEPRLEYEQFVRLGIDGIISDFPETAVAARAEAAREPG